MTDFDFEDAARFCKAQLALGDAAADSAFAHAGELLLEAYPQLSRRAWPKWLARNFGISVTDAERYMALARRRRRINRED